MIDEQQLTQWLISSSIIYIYSFTTAIYSPLPSEAPMFAFPELSRLEVLFWCALGKSSGAYTVFISGATIRESKLFNKILNFLRLTSLWSRFFEWMRSFMKTHGVWGFFLFMSIPFMPMRTAIYSVSLLEVNRLSLILAVAVGTVIRNSIVYWGFRGLQNISHYS
jgi:uncharacterized membrane protein